MPGLARGLTPGRSSCGFTVFIIVLFIHLCIYLFILFFFCFFFLLLLLSSSFSASSSSWVRLPLLAEVCCLFWQDFFRMVVILRACVRVAVAEFLWSVTDLTKGENPHTGYTFTSWVVSFTPPRIEYQVGGTSILRLFRRTVESHEIDSRYPDWTAWQVWWLESGTQLGPPIQVLALPDDRLTHWGRATHICVGNLTIIGSDNGLAPGRRQAIIWTNDGILLIRPLGTNFSEISIEILTFSFKKMRLKLSSAKWRPFCLGLNVLTSRKRPCS